MSQYAVVTILNIHDMVFWEPHLVGPSECSKALDKEVASIAELYGLEENRIFVTKINVDGDAVALGPDGGKCEVSARILGYLDLNSS